MLFDPDELAFLLRLPDGTDFQVEDHSTSEADLERAAFMADGQLRAVELRRVRDLELAANEAAIREALDRASYPGVVPLTAIANLVTVSPWIDAIPAAGLAADLTGLGRGVELLAALHALDIREGLDWELSPAAIAGEPGIDLHRLGFAATEREAAGPGLALAHEALLATPAGFAHRDATAANLRLHGAGVSFGGWQHAGHGFPALDLVSLLWTSPLDAAQRRGLIAAYNAASTSARFDPELLDLIALRWGLLWLMALPRRLVQTLGADVESEQLRVMASNVERAIRQPTGAHPAATAIRSALWPQVP